jgi:hypothetical protein
MRQNQKIYDLPLYDVELPVNIPPKRTFFGAGYTPDFGDGYRVCYEEVVIRDKYFIIL